MAAFRPVWNFLKRSDTHSNNGGVRFPKHIYVKQVERIKTEERGQKKGGGQMIKARRKKRRKQTERRKTKAARINENEERRQKIEDMEFL